MSKELKRLRPYALYVKQVCDSIGLSFDEYTVSRGWDHLLFEQRKIIISIEENPFGQISLSIPNHPPILVNTINELVEELMV